MRSVKIVPISEEINSHCGIFPAGRLLRRFGFRKLDSLDSSPTKCAEYPSGELFLAYIATLCLGHRDFYDIGRFRDDRAFKVALGIKRVPSEATVRERISIRPEAYEELRKMNSGAVWDLMKPSHVVVGKKKMVFADLDVSVHDNCGARKREGVGMTYKGVLGFSPAYLYVGKEGYMLDSELRPGTQHCQKGTPELMARAMDGAGRRGIRLLFRMDSGNDASENILLCHSRKHSYIIACNPRRSDLSVVAEEAELFGDAQKTAEKEVFVHRETFFHDGKCGGKVKAYRIVRLERTFFDKNGQKLLVPSEEISMWWTNLYLPAQEVIGLYNDHGTSEQYHSEMKTDLDMEKFPALSFAMNQVVHASAMVAFNVLRKMGLDAAAMDKRRDSPLRLRIKTVIMEIVRTAGKFVYTGNEFFLKISERSPSFKFVEHLYHAYG